MGFDARVTGIGSLFGIHFTKKKNVRDLTHYSEEHKEHAKRLFTFLLNNGNLLLATDLPHGAISYSHSESEIDTLVSCVEEYLKSQGR